MTEKLLLIDDDHELATLIIDYLQPHGYQIEHAQNGAEGLERIRHYDYSLILLDVMMPELDGFDVLKALRPHNITPVIMLTARGEDLDRILGLEMGADDYLAKPFNPRELAARVKAMLRREQLNRRREQQGDIRSDTLSLVPATQQATCCDQPLTLTSTEFATLKLLMQNAGQLVTKEAISENVLGRKLAPFDRSIDMHISNIRKKCSAVDERERIRTVRGAGYIFTENLR